MLLNNCHKLSALWNDTDLDIRRARRLVRLDLPGSRSCGSSSFSLFAHDSVVPVPMPDRTAWYDESGRLLVGIFSLDKINLLTRCATGHCTLFYLPIATHAVAPATVCWYVWVQSTWRTAASRLESLGRDVSKLLFCNTWNRRGCLQRLRATVHWYVSVLKCATVISSCVVPIVSRWTIDARQRLLNRQIRRRRSAYFLRYWQITS